MPSVQPPEPRWGTKRRPELPSRGSLDAEVADLLGWRLFPWQRYVADVAGEYDPSTKLPHYRTVGVSVPRQNGKTTLVCSRIARQLIPPRQTVAYTAQDRGLARTKWDEHIGLLLSTRSQTALPVSTAPTTAKCWCSRTARATCR